MTTRADLLALADRVEREEPSRELDARIAKAIGWTQNDPRDADDWAGWTDPARPGRIFIPRHWTSSLDAAASLCPAGWKLCDVWVIEYVVVRLLNAARTYAVGMADDEPRARTAAALRARAQEMGDE